VKNICSSNWDIVALQQVVLSPDQKNQLMNTVKGQLNFSTVNAKYLPLLPG
jgi:hypothetical protein